MVEVPPPAVEAERDTEDRKKRSFRKKSHPSNNRSKCYGQKQTNKQTKHSSSVNSKDRANIRLSEMDVLNVQQL